MTIEDEIMQTLNRILQKAVTIMRDPKQSQQNKDNAQRILQESTEFVAEETHPRKIALLLMKTENKI